MCATASPGAWNTTPPLEAVASVFASTFNDYVRAELNYKSDLPYEILANLQWDWGEQNRYLDVGRDPGRQPHPQPLPARPCLQRPLRPGHARWSAVRYTLNHLQMDPDLAKNITLDTYTAGHMMYLNLPRPQKAEG